MVVEHIPDEDYLYRRIHPEQLNPKTGEVSSAAYTHYKISVDWERYTTTQQIAFNYPTFHIARILALIPREKNLEVKHDPIIEENPAHSLIIGHKKHATRKFLSRNSELICRIATPPSQP